MEVCRLIKAMQGLRLVWGLRDKNWKGSSVYEDASRKLIIVNLEKHGFYLASIEGAFEGFEQGSDRIISVFCFVLF